MAASCKTDIGYHEAAEFIKSKTTISPDVAVVLGSGLSGLAKDITDCVRLPYGDIPFFPASTAPSHEGALYCGLLGGVPVYALSGRFHCYEGYTMRQSSFYTGVLSLLGVKKLILTNAAGAVNTAFDIGDIMLITDHIKLAAESPLAGPHDPLFGSRFADMTNIYDIETANLVRKTAAELGIKLREGVYMYFAGPQYETPAEIKAASILGADAVGMSTVPESIAAHAAGIKVTAFSIITNMAAGLSDTHPDETEVIRNAAAANLNLAHIINQLINKLTDL